jgi:hypothetical protein
VSRRSQSAVAHVALPLRVAAFGCEVCVNATENKDAARKGRRYKSQLWTAILIFPETFERFC